MVAESKRAWPAQAGEPDPGCLPVAGAVVTRTAALAVVATTMAAASEIEREERRELKRLR
jgi:hypothetical protein